MMFCQYQNATDMGNVQKVELSVHNLDLRQQSVQKAALELGVKLGLYQTSEAINSKLNSMTTILYQLYNFSPLMLSDYVVPPVIQSGYNDVTVNSDRKITATSIAYRIKIPAKLAVMPPTWRNYLDMPYSLPPMPDASLLPKDKFEKYIWDKTIAYGCIIGEKQGFSIFQQNLNKLTSDYLGMLLYHQLVAVHMISPAYVSEKSYGISSDGSKLAIDQKAYALTSLPIFQKETIWKPIIEVVK